MIQKMDKIRLEVLKRICILNICFLIIFTSCKTENNKNINSISVLHKAEDAFREDNYKEVYFLTDQIIQSTKSGDIEDSIRANALMLKSIASRIEGNYSVAIESCEKARETREKLYGAKHTYLLSIYNNLGNIYSDIGRYKAAVKSYERALECEGIKNATKITIYNNIGDNLILLKNYTQALDYLKKAISDTSANNISYPYHNLGVCYRELNDSEKALGFFKLSIQKTKDNLSSDHFLITQSLLGIADTYRYSKDYNTALSYYKQSQQIDHNNNLLKLRVLYGKAFTLFLQDKMKASLFVVQKADQLISEVRSKLTAQDKVLFSEQAHNVNILGLKIALMQGDDNNLFHFSERDKANILRNILDIETRSLKEIQGKLNSNQVLIEYKLLDSLSLIRLEITHNSFHKTMLNYPSIQSKISLFISTLTDVNEEKEILKAGNTLYDSLLGKINLSSDQELIIVPDDIIWKVPFDAFSKNTEEYLIKDHLITYAPSAAIALGSHSKNEEYEYEYIGFAPEFEDLPTSIEEVEHSAEFFPYLSRKIFTGKNATISNFRNVQSSRVLHISTHSTTVQVDRQNGRKFEKGLTFSDGILFTDIIQDDLSSDLVVLSSCGDISNIKYIRGEGYQTLMYVFLPRANFVIYPVFNIDDIASYNLIGLFFTNVDKGLSYKKALHMAKLEAMKLKNASPLYWAGLVITY